ncbi:hypothetical protein BESB_048280 [Besnoitia besnoiti]|uniref:non-specific serine/threonine protein kinase n=1 Tax=Besnoitia besnoiti TaxID=94643 RepID=A0A2A9MKV3_BESBE|nr:hypothetical protein BESB_048280 [Besnoitia besnoiti]PFH36636.1 hypothetical protein BESB_048280 [Besnoitia besnoiti]
MEPLAWATSDEVRTDSESENETLRPEGLKEKLRDNLRHSDASEAEGSDPGRFRRSGPGRRAPVVAVSSQPAWIVVRLTRFLARPSLLCEVQEALDSQLASLYALRRDRLQAEVARRQRAATLSSLKVRGLSGRKKLSANYVEGGNPLGGVDPEAEHGDATQGPYFGRRPGLKQISSASSQMLFTRKRKGGSMAPWTDSGSSESEAEEATTYLRRFAVKFDHPSLLHHAYARAAAWDFTTLPDRVLFAALQEATEKAAHPPPVNAWVFLVKASVHLFSKSSRDRFRGGPLPGLFSGKASFESTSLSSPCSQFAVKPSSPYSHYSPPMQLRQGVRGSRGEDSGAKAFFGLSKQADSESPEGRAAEASGEGVGAGAQPGDMVTGPMYRHNAGHIANAGGCISACAMAVSNMGTRVLKLQPELCRRAANDDRSARGTPEAMDALVENPFSGGDLPVALPCTFSPLLLRPMYENYSSETVPLPPRPTKRRDLEEVTRGESSSPSWSSSADETTTSEVSETSSGSESVLRGPKRQGKKSLEGRETVVVLNLYASCVACLPAPRGAETVPQPVLIATSVVRLFKHKHEEYRGHFCQPLYAPRRPRLASGDAYAAPPAANTSRARRKGAGFRPDSEVESDLAEDDAPRGSPQKPDREGTLPDSGFDGGIIGGYFLAGRNEAPKFTLDGGALRMLDDDDDPLQANQRSGRFVETNALKRDPRDAATTLNWMRMFGLWRGGVFLARGEAAAHSQGESDEEFAFRRATEADYDLALFQHHFLQLEAIEQATESRRNRRQRRMRMRMQRRRASLANEAPQPERDMRVAPGQRHNTRVASERGQSRTGGGRRLTKGRLQGLFSSSSLSHAAADSTERLPSSLPSRRRSLFSEATTCSRTERAGKRTDSGKPGHEAKGTNTPGTDTQKSECQEQATRRGEEAEAPDARGVLDGTTLPQGTPPGRQPSLKSREFRALEAEQEEWERRREERDQLRLKPLTLAVESLLNEKGEIVLCNGASHAAKRVAEGAGPAMKPGGARPPLEAPRPGLHEAQESIRRQVEALAHRYSGRQRDLGHRGGGWLNVALKENAERRVKNRGEARDSLAALPSHALPELEVETAVMRHHKSQQGLGEDTALEDERGRNRFLAPAYLTGKSWPSQQRALLALEKQQRLEARWVAATASRLRWAGSSGKDAPTPERPAADPPRRTEAHSRGEREAAARRERHLERKPHHVSPPHRLPSCSRIRARGAAEPIRESKIQSLSPAPQRPPEREREMRTPGSSVARPVKPHAAAPWEPPPKPLRPPRLSPLPAGLSGYPSRSSELPASPPASLGAHASSPARFQLLVSPPPSLVLPVPQAAESASVRGGGPSASLQPPRDEHRLRTWTVQLLRNLQRLHATGRSQRDLHQARSLRQPVPLHLPAKNERLCAAMRGRARLTLPQTASPSSAMAASPSPRAPCSPSCQVKARLGLPCPYRILRQRPERRRAGEGTAKAAADSSRRGPGEDDADSQRVALPPGVPLCYLPPEELLPAFQGATAGMRTTADMWQLGVLLFEVLAGRPLFEANSVEDLRATLGTRGVLGEAFLTGLSDADCSFVCQDFIASLLQLSPSERPTAAEALRHPWFLS